MNVVQVPAQILLVAHGMLPESPLPDSALALAKSAGGNALVWRELRGKRRLDTTPAIGVVIIARRETPNGVQVVGQDDQGNERKRCVPFLSLDGRVEEDDVTNEKIPSPVGKGHREEISPSRDTVAAI